MKKIMSLVMVVLLVMASCVNVFAYNGNPTANYYGYDYNYGYNNYNNNYNNGYGYGYGYCTGIRTTYSDREYQHDAWFDVYDEEYGVTFHLYPNMPIIRSDVFAPIGKAMQQAYDDAGRNFSNAYGVNFRDFTWDTSLYEVAGGLYQRGIMIGYPEDGTVRFSNNITRGEFAKVVALVAKQNGITTYSNMTYEFPDMVGHWASQYASQCQAMGLLVGKGNGFDPEGYVTYQEYVTVMLRMSELANSSVYSIDFEDVAYGISSTMDIDFEDYEYSNEFELSASGSKTVYMSVGETEELKVKASPSDIELDDNDIEWEASKSGYVRLSGEDIEDERYAIVNVKALKEGKVVVTAMAKNDEDVSVDFTIIIGDEEDDDNTRVTSIKVNPTEVELEVGTSELVTATVYPTTASNKTLVWESHNTAVATVSQSGKITAVGVGNTTVTATSKEDNDIVATIDVTVTAERKVDDSTAPEVEITGADNVSVGQKVILTVVVDDENLETFQITEKDILGLTGGVSINRINKVSDDTYEITLMGVEVSSLAICIDSGVAVDTSGNKSSESNEVIIFVNSGEEL